MLKTPQKLTVPLHPNIQIKTDKRVQFSQVCFKNLIHVYGPQKIWYVWSYRGKGHHTSSHWAQRSEITTKLKQNFWGKGGVTIEQNMLIKMGCRISLGSSFVSGFAEHAWDCVFMGRGFSRA